MAIIVGFERGWEDGTSGALRWSLLRPTPSTRRTLVSVLHPRLPPAGQADGHTRPLVGWPDARPVGRLRGVVQPASGRDHRHDRGGPRQTGDGRHVLQRGPHRGLLRHHRGDARGVRPLQGAHRTDHRRVGMAAGEVGARPGAAPGAADWVVRRRRNKSIEGPIAARFRRGAWTCT